MDLVSVVIPTLNRPAPLWRAIESLARQLDSADFAFEIIVVDNSADGTARVPVAEMAAHIDIPVRYLHQPNPGVSSARNTGVRAAKGRWVAFLDDDEEAEPAWLSSLVATVRKTGADVVFGPVIAKGERADITKRAADLGTNNSMFDRLRCLHEISPFDESLNSSGGEDSLLLKRLAIAGRRFCWAPKAGVIEWVPESRLNWGYVRKRKFLSGQIRVFVLGMLQPVRWLEIASWMAIGAVQLSLSAIAMLVFMPFRGPRYARASVTFFAGLGKLLWLPRFRPALYGAGLIS